MTKQTYLLALSMIACACGQAPAAEPSDPEPAAQAPAVEPEPSEPGAPDPDPEPEPAAPVAEAPAAEPEPSAPVPSEAPSAKPAAKKPAPEPAQEEPAKAESAKAEAPTPSAPATPTAAAEPCGEDGQPMCPLQAFMDKNLQAPMDTGDLAAVSKGLTRTVKLVPDASWNAGESGWAAIAEAGAKAALAGDEAAVKQSCKSCHKAFRNKYKAGFRTKPL